MYAFTKFNDKLFVVSWLDASNFLNICKVKYLKLDSSCFFIELKALLHDLELNSNSNWLKSEENKTL